MARLSYCPQYRNPLYHFTTDKHYTHSTIVAITGPKRSGKSLLLARLLVGDLCKQRKVWSTMDVTTPLFMRDKGYPVMHSDVIDWDAFYMLDEAYGEGTIGLDEGIYYDDSRASLSAKNKLLNTVMNQVGHRNLNVYYTLKTKGWVDKRLQFETDIEIRCFDLAMSPWGRRNHVGRGRVIRLEFYDMSGAFTGRPFDAKYHFRPFQTLVWKNADLWWTAYDTKKIVGLEDLYTGVKVDLKQRVISNKSKINAGIRDALQGLVESFRSRGEAEVSCDGFWTIAESMGIAGDRRQLGQHLRGLGVTRKQKGGGQTFYVLGT